MRTAREVLGVLCVAATACSLPPKPDALAPLQLRSTKPPADVIAIAARELTSAGFTLTASDANAGLLSAARVRSPEQQGGDVTCAFAPGSIGARLTEAHYTVSVTAARDSVGGATVQIASSVLVKDSSGMPPSLRTGDSADSCAGTGVLERRLAAAMR